ncbi:MAG: YfdX family protein [Pseudomonadota bacterium]|nr:YfdX family protein [Pseudomonadota bacterium]MEE3070267.1 YfdX family protein [Pseudomonadota bacterium]
MKSNTRIAALALTAFMASVSLPAFAATGEAPAYQTQPGMLKTADEALQAVTRAHAARLALFNNDIEAAKGRLAEARAEFLKAEKSLDDLTIGDTEDPTNAARYLPFDMSMAVSENFKATKENTQALERAYGLMQTGSPDDAIEVLRVASIDMNVSTAMLPIVEASAQFEKAQTLVDEGKYFEANLALKAVEDSIIVQTFSIDAIPQQGDVS